MNGLWYVCLLAVVRGASVQSGNVQWFDIVEAQKHPEQLHILRTKAGINYQPYEQAWKEFKILHGNYLIFIHGDNDPVFFFVFFYRVLTTKKRH